MSGERSAKKISSKTNTVATKILLDNTRYGFKNENFVCSPFSLETLMGMLASRAEGKTLQQLLDFLGYETLDQVLYESPSAKLLAQLLSNQGRGGDAGPDICFANGVWVDKKMIDRVQSCYKKVLQSVYKTEPSFVDFENKTESARKINSWVNQKTRGLIPAIVGDDDLTRVVIVHANTLYFKGLWYDDYFDATRTKEKDFHLIDDGETTVSIPFMTSRHRFSYRSSKCCKILQIPYKSDEGESMKFSMYIFLPHRKDGLRKLLKGFHSDPALFHRDFMLEDESFDELWIPKFKISYRFEAQDVMKQLGLILPFHPYNMELTKIIEVVEPGDDILYVKKVIQKSFIEVDEAGTEAAACNYCDDEVGFSYWDPPPPKPSFVADHPFMFMIREDTSRAVFFMGVVLNPRGTGQL